MSSPLPEGNDPVALRAWLRERRGAPHRISDDQQDPLTHDQFLRQQYSRLLASAGLSVDTGTDVSEEAAPYPVDMERPRIDLALSGGVVVGYEAPIALLGSFFTHLQNAVSAVAQTLTGSPTVASQVPGHIRAATLLRSAGTFNSSYGVHLYGPPAPNESQQQQLPGLALHGYRADERLLEDSITTICDIVDATHMSDDGEADDRLTGQVVPLGQRAIKHLGELSATLSEGEVGVSLVWQPDTAESRRCLLEPAGARRLKRISDVVEFDESEPRVVEGLLSAVDLRRRTVEILLDSGTPINARVVDELTARLMEGVLGRRIVADADVSVVRYATGRERELYVLTTLNPVGEN